MSEAEQALAKAEELLERLRLRRDELERLAAARGRRCGRRRARRARGDREGGRGRARPRRASARPMRSPDELRELVEGYLGELAFTPELGGLEAALRYPIESGGKRVRPVICLAVGEAAGAAAEQLPAGGGRARARAQVLARPRRPAGDRRRRRAPRPPVRARRVRRGRRRCSPATRCSPRRSGSRSRTRRRWSAASSRRRRSAMIGGQYLDVTGDTADLAALHRLKTGALFSAAVGARALGRGGAGGASRPPGARSATSSGCSSRSSTTSSTATATRSRTVPRGARARRRRRPSGRRRGSTRSRPTPRCSPRSSTASPSGWRRSPDPPPRVLAAFGRTASVEPLAGGQGHGLAGGRARAEAARAVDEPRGARVAGAGARRRSTPAASASRGCGARSTAPRSSTAGARGSSSRASTASVRGRR